MARRAWTLALIGVVVAAVLLRLSCCDEGRHEVGHPVPGVVALVLNRTLPGDPYQGTFCSGVLVGSSVVLTAAHCVAGQSPGSFYTILGADNLCRDRPVDGERVDVAAISIHQLYDETTGVYDLAELTLERSASLPPRQMSNAVSAGPASSYGWGSSAEGTATSCRLEKIPLTIPLQETCAAVLGQGRRTFDSATMICALPQGAGNTCYGDSGGPLIAGNDDDSLGPVIGIVSWGRDCTGGGAYARVSDWPFTPSTYTSAEP